MIDNARRRGRPADVAEISIARRLDRAGEGEYRLNGARCRLVDVLEVLSDTGLGKEMHSVVSQGRVEAIVTSKPRDRRLLIEEAAGLGKHRKRRRRAQLKLERTQDNLDRALDVEREARSRLRPLKRQAEAAELHERLERQTLEARWTLARDDARGRRARRWPRPRPRRAARASGRDETEARAARRSPRAARPPRRRSPRAAASARRCPGRFYAARSAAERIGLRAGAARASAVADARARASARRERALAALADEPPASRRPSDDGAARADRGARARARAAGRRTARRGWSASSPSSRSAARPRGGRAARARSAAAAAAASAARARPSAAAEAARAAAASRARRRGGPPRGRARRRRAGGASTSSCARRPARPAARPALADALRAEPGYELALAAALGPRLRAAVAADLRRRRAALLGPRGPRRRRRPGAPPAGSLHRARPAVRSGGPRRPAAALRA